MVQFPSSTCVFVKMVTWIYFFIHVATHFWRCNDIKSWIIVNKHIIMIEVSLLVNKIQICTLFFPNLPWRIIWQYCKGFQIFTLWIFHNDVIFSLLPIEHIYIRGIGWCHHWRKSIWVHIAHACILWNHALNLVWRMMNIFQFFNLQDKLNKEFKYLIQNET